MMAVEIADQLVVLPVRDPRVVGADVDLGVAAPRAALRAAWRGLLGNDADGDACRAALAARSVDDVLAAAEADARQGFVELHRIAAPQLGEDLALHLARQIGARAWRSHEESRKAERLVGHGQGLWGSGQALRRQLRGPSAELGRGGRRLVEEQDRNACVLRTLG